MRCSDVTNARSSCEGSKDKARAREGSNALTSATDVAEANAATVFETADARAVVAIMNAASPAPTIEN